MITNPIFINNICIGLLSNCNWNCKYCIARDNSKQIDEELILKQIIPIKNKLKTLWLSGGEPGILSTNFWDRLFSLTNYKLSICTNGTFILNGFTDRYKSKIKCIMIHCVKELDHDIHSSTLDFIKNSKIKKVVNIVIHKQNTHLIRSFLKKYSDIKFDINFTDETFMKYRKDIGYQYVIDKNASIEILHQLSGFGKYYRHSSMIAKCIIKNNFKYLNAWASENKKQMINGIIQNIL